VTVEDLEDLFDYGYWANRKVFLALAPLPPEQFTEALAGSYGSIRNTLVHAMSAEWGWLSRCGGPERGPALKADDYPTVASVTEQWGRIEGYMRQFLSTLKGEEVSRDVEFVDPQGARRTMVMGELMRHAAAHSVHHRGQVALLLRLIGHSAGNFDMFLYYTERRHPTTA
jgi:uncharacterized damage-inducible protein DinB